MKGRVAVRTVVAMMNSKKAMMRILIDEKRPRDCYCARSRTPGSVCATR